MPLGIPELQNPIDVPSFIHSEIQGAVQRAVSAGAPAPLEFVGVGMYGIVFCDSVDHAWKVARLHKKGDENERDFMLESTATEYEWLRDAGGTPIAKNVAKVYAIHASSIVLERECVRGRAGSWADGTKLAAVHDLIWKVMEPQGWTAPEFKENSYIIRDDGTAVLVDISMAIRTGMNLAGWIEDILNGRRKTRDTWSSLAFYLLRERREKTIPEGKLKELLDRLVEKDPGIRRHFIL